MRTRSDISRVLLPSLVILLAQSVPTVQAQEKIEFFDDFSRDSISYLVDDRPDDKADRSFVISPDGIEMRVSAKGEDQGYAQIHIADRTDTVRTRFSLSSETDLPVGDDDDVRIRISGPWYNEIQDGGLGGDNRTGDVYVQARLRLKDNNRSEFSICMDRTLDDGSNESADIFGSDGGSCTKMPDFEVELDKVYEAKISLDRVANTLTFGIDGQDLVADIGRQVYLPSQHQKRIELGHEGSGQAVGRVTAIGTDGDLQDFSVSPLASGPYQPLWDLQEGLVSLTVNDDARVRFEATAPANEQENLGLAISGSSNRIEGVIELSSETNLVGGEDSFAQMRLSGTFYNDTAAGGFNESEGNVFAALMLRETSGAVHMLQYCLYRADTADFSAATELVMQDGTECGDFGIVAELDTPYSASIDTDLAAGIVTFTVDDVVREHIITTAAYEPDPARQYVRAQARASAGSTVVGYLDNFGTSADAPLVVDTVIDTNSGTNGGTDGGTSSGGSSGGGAADWSFMMMSLVALLAGSRRRTLVQSL